MRSYQKMLSIRNKISYISRQPAHFLILAAIIAFHLINNIIVISNHVAYPYESVGAYLSNTMQLSDSISGPLPDVMQALQRFNYPLGYFALSVPLYLAFGMGALRYCAINTGFFVLLLFSVYQLGRLLLSRNAGLLAAFLVSFFPAGFAASRYYLPDYAFMCCISLSIYLMLKTDNFTNEKFSTLFGLSLGLAASIRVPAYIYILGPAVIFCIGAFAAGKKGHMRLSARNLGLAVLIAVLAALPFYLPVFINIVQHHALAVGFGEASASAMTADNILYYPRLMAGSMIMPLFFLVFLCSFLAFFLVRDRRLMIVLAWILVPYLFFTFLVPYNKSPRFMLPVLPAVSLLMAVFIGSIRRARLRHAMTLLIIIAGVSQFFLTSYFPQSYHVIASVSNLGHGPAGRYFNLDAFPYIFYADDGLGMFPPATAQFGLLHSIRTDWGIREAGEVIRNRAGASPARPIAVETFNQIVSMPLKYYVETEGIPASVMDSEHRPPSEGFGSPDVVIVTNMTRMHEFTGIEYLERINIHMAKFRQESGYANVRNISLPDGSAMQIYKRMKN
ncbi:MAG: phospholipid carrier-dependent glycosyltransferase [archaeon]